MIDIVLFCREIFARKGFEGNDLGRGIVFVSIGSIKSKWSTSSWWQSGLTTLSVGAALLAYSAGVMVKQLVQ